MKRQSLAVLVALSIATAATAGGNTLLVTEVREDCTVVFDGGFAIHLTGITFPDPDTELGREACDFVRRRIAGQRVAVFTWTTDGTAAGIVWGDDKLAFATILYGEHRSIDIAAQLLERGLARVDPERLPQIAQHYREIEWTARVHGLGVWSSRSDWR